MIVVGNIVAGGSGKTPLLISLCEYLKDKGFKPGVVSRGYGGSVVGIKQISLTDDANLVGDEPLMIHQKTTVPVVVGSDRVAAVDYLISNNECNVILSDDGLQHYRMRRNFEIAVVDSSRKFGNGFCLPAGPLRERIARLKEVDMVIYNGDVGLDSSDYSYQLKILSLKQLNADEDRNLTSFVDRTIHAVAGIGDPVRFFKQLENSGITVVEHAYPDHHDFIQDDFNGWGDECIIMTDKDAVKCRNLNLKDAWALSVEAVLSSNLKSSLSSDLLPLLNK